MNEMTAVAELDEAVTLQALGALAQPQRLRAFRALVKAGRMGMTPGMLGAQLGLTPSALSFHLKGLAAAGLVASEPCGRHLIYRADFRRMDQLLAYLMANCCEGACGVADGGADCGC